MKDHLWRTGERLCVRSERRWRRGHRLVNSLRWKCLIDHLDLPPIQETPHLTPNPDTCPNWMLNRGRGTLAQRHRKAIVALEVIRMKIAFQKYSLAHVTPWFRSLQKFLISLSMQRKLHAGLRAQSVWAAAFASSACPEESLPP